jgi:hypothetical protein
MTPGPAPPAGRRDSCHQGAPPVGSLPPRAADPTGPRPILRPSATSGHRRPRPAGHPTSPTSPVRRHGPSHAGPASSVGHPAIIPEPRPPPGRGDGGRLLGALHLGDLPLPAAPRLLVPGPCEGGVAVHRHERVQVRRSDVDADDLPRPTVQRPALEAEEGAVRHHETVVLSATTGPGGAWFPPGPQAPGTTAPIPGHLLVSSPWPVSPDRPPVARLGACDGEATRFPPPLSCRGGSGNRRDVLVLGGGNAGGGPSTGFRPGRSLSRRADGTVPFNGVAGSLLVGGELFHRSGCHSSAHGIGPP